MRYDANLWIRAAGDHYEMVTTYIDDVLVFARDPSVIINKLKETYTLIGVGEPEYYLGGNIEYMDEGWKKQGIGYALSACTYIHNAVQKVERIMGGTIRSARTPFAETYHPELDDSELLGKGDGAIYRTMIGCANWMITLVRYDIQYAVSSLSRFSMFPRKGHLRAMMRVFGYVKYRPNGRLLCNPAEPQYEIPEEKHMERWKEFYPEACKELPHNLPVSLGRGAMITVFVDADHAHDQVTRRSVTGILAKVNGMIVCSYSKRQ
jgi:hypothetical protein